MRPSILLAAAPLALAVPAPSPVTAPNPIPAPQFKGPNIGTPLTGILGSFIQGATSIGSLKDAVPALINDLAQVGDSLGEVTAAIANGTILGTDVPAVVQKVFQAAQPTSKPTSIPDAANRAAALLSVKTPPSSGAPQQNLVENAVGLVLNGFTSSDVEALKQGIDPLRNTYYNNNRPLPAVANFFTLAGSRKLGNAPFSIPEAQLRAAMYIPSDFTWGKKQPVIMSPGTGATGYINFRSNIGKLLSATDFADPVYLNIPNALVGDAQLSAEYVAYAIQYMRIQARRQPAVVTWSQGSLNAQWAFKYWPHIRSLVTDHIAISPDYHGTSLAYALCPGFDLGNAPACVPSVYQQTYNSKFVTQLRSGGGDSAYVPTTTVYSALDEIVQPQQGTAASGFIRDDRNVGVSNTFLQGACLGDLGGVLYTHEGVLYNPVAYALVVDALQHAGPGNFDRVKGQCSAVVAPGLSLGDVIETEALIPLAILNIASFLPKVYEEPAIKGYAAR